MSTPHVYTVELPNTTVPVNSGNLLGTTNNLGKTVRDLEMSGCIRGQEGGVGEEEEGGDLNPAWTSGTVLALITRIIAAWLISANKVIVLLYGVVVR